MFTVTKTVTKYKLVNFVIEKNRKLLKRYILDKWHISILTFHYMYVKCKHLKLEYLI